jgi:hypothetical protein
MTPLEETELRRAIARHEREINELREHVKALEDGHMKERVEAEITKKMADLEADLKLRELQETMAKEQEQLRRKHRFFHRE